MPILHMQTETVRGTGQQINQMSESLRQQAQQLGNRTQQLAYEWQGPSASMFEQEMQALLQKARQTAEIGSALNQKVQREADEWEQVAATWGVSLSWSAGVPSLPTSGGTNAWLSEATSFLTTVSLPQFFAIHSLADLVKQGPGWLQEQLARFLPFLQPPPPESFDSNFTTTPTPEIANQANGATATPLGELLNTPPAPAPVTTPVTDLPSQSPSPVNVGETAVSSPPSPTTPVTNYYPVPVKSQGSLGGGAACAPTATSMVLDYYHQLNGQNKTASPEMLMGMLDKGDFTPGKGMSLSNITNELETLGYQGTTQLHASTADLQTHLQDGPVLATVNLNTKTGELSANGNVTHAVVVKGVSADGQTVFINDPWVGKEVSLPIKNFEATWDKGLRGLYIIRPASVR